VPPTPSTASALAGRFLGLIGGFGLHRASGRRSTNAGTCTPNGTSKRAFESLTARTIWYDPLDKTRQDKTRHDEKRHDKTRGENIKEETRTPDETIHENTTQDTTRDYERD
jgi:hypothetical protein